MTTGGVRALFAKLEDEEPITVHKVAELVGLGPSRTDRLLAILVATGDVLRDEYGLIVTAEPSRRQAPLPICCERVFETAAEAAAHVHTGGAE